MSIRLPVVTVVALLTACGDATPPSGPSSTFDLPHTVAGIVRARGAGPIAGARVRAIDQSIPPVLTDSAGGYTLVNVESEAHPHIGPLLSASAAGYFTGVEYTSRFYVPLTSNARLDLELDPLVEVALGEVVHGRVPEGPRVCSHWGYGASACKRVAVVAPASGLLEVTLAGARLDFDYDVVGPDGTFLVYGSTSPSPARFSFAVEAGATYEVRVAGAGQPRDFELTVALR